ncbi:MAG: hypothetical protein FWG93_08250 [Oscillospiraceae bacterium]|nr:hypothetical protein [Oscillospiraceae bacterium]
MAGIQINTAPVRALQVDGVQASQKARAMNGIAPAAQPKAAIPSAMPKQVVEGDQASRRARTMNGIAPGQIPDAVGNFTSNMKQIERMAFRRPPDAVMSQSTDVSI